MALLRGGRKGTWRELKRGRRQVYGVSVDEFPKKRENTLTIAGVGFSSTGGLMARFFRKRDGEMPSRETE